MKLRITFAMGLWHVTEPSGEVVWHFRTLPEAADKATVLANVLAGAKGTRQNKGVGMDGAPK